LSEENKAKVRRFYEEVFGAGRLERADELFAPNFLLHDPSFPRRVHGPEGMRRYVGAYRAAFPDLQLTVEDQLAEGDKVVTRWTARGTHRGDFLGILPSGNVVAVTGIGFDRLGDDRIDEAWVAYHPFAGPIFDPGQVQRGFAAMREAFPDLRTAEVDSVSEGEKRAFRWLMSGTHEGEFMGVAPTGKRVEAMGMDIVRVADAEILEHWGEFDVMGLLRQLGIVRPPEQIGG
jgi:steroid delta-isomerase-like uncharacterized protein